MINLKRKSLTIFLILISFILGFFYRHGNPKYLVYFKNNLVIKLQKIFNSHKTNNSEGICPKRISSPLLSSDS